MAKVEKMLISGIRSYPPDGQSVIEFQTPLTLIVGPNGTGKTSIIESLKYITTGDLPPGTKGGAFIHDPKIAREKEVKGQVKLRFVDITGNRIDCVRSMVSTQKAKKLETKSIDGVIKKQTPSGELESISSRCTDFTKEMISRLGVSKAVLDNVVFCHQEDSTWPLSEGKVLKQKFDAIFAATRYIQALEAIRKVRKEQGTEVKMYQSELNYLTEVKQKSQEINKDLNKAEGQVTCATDQIKKISDSLRPIEVQLEEIEKVLQDVFKVEKKIETLKSRKDQLRKNIRDLESKIETKMEGTEEELTRMKSEFAETLEEEETSLSNLETLVKRLNIELRRLDENKTELVKENGKLQQEEKAYNNIVQEKNRLISKMAQEHNIQDFCNATEFTNYQSDAFLKNIQDLFKATVNEGKISRESFTNQLDTVEKKIKDYEKQLNTIEGGIAQKKKTMDQNNRKLEEIETTLSSLKASANRLPNLERELKNAENELKMFKSETDQTKLNEDIAKMQQQKASDEKLLIELRHEENLMIQQSTAQTKVDMLLKDKATKEEHIQNTFDRHEEKMERIFGSRPSMEDLKENLGQFLRKKQVEIRSKQKESDDIVKKIAGKESERKMMKEQLREKESNLLLSKKELDEVCQENDYNEFRESVRQNVEQYTSALVEISAFERIYQKYIAQLQTKESQHKGCPLCHRKFSNPREIKTLTDELNQKLYSVPEKREQNQLELERAKELHESLIYLAPTKSTVDVISEELPKLTKKVDLLNKDIESEKTRLSKVMETKQSLEELEKDARSLESDVNRLDDFYYDLKDLDRQIKMEGNKLHGIKPGRTMDQVRNEVQEKQELMNTFSKKIEQKRQKLITYQQQLSIQERNMNDLRSQMLKLQSELERRTYFETQKVELQTTNTSYEREVRDTEKQIQPIKNYLKDCNEEKRDIEDSKEISEDEIRQKLERIKNYGNDLRKKIATIKEYIDGGKETALSDNKEQLERVEENMKRKHQELEKKKKEISKIQEKKVSQELRLREIDDNIALLKTRKEITQIDSDVENHKQELDRFGNYNELSTKRSNFQQKLDRLRKDKAEIEGRKKGFEDEVKRCERDLASSMYADAEKRHCDKLIELKTTELASEDLDKYYKALDRAIMKYHGLKLAEINKIIKEYWVRTYRGNDIDSIEIVSEHDEEGSGASKTRRNYNYRVCMIKKGTSLDMRGRCSAGQKVLASIIIRLALAETFCLNCGILALDEPTTNLDEANIKSLANSLRNVIEFRMQQKNFQLIIITHDEDFVRALGRGAEYVEYYFAVYKDDKGNSKIHRKRMELRE